nr:MAG TPA: terminase small subunit [Caudoviricetes sp.]
MDKQIAENIGCSVSTLCEWKNKFPEFSEALKKGKEVADYIVENELFESCKTRTVTVRKPIKLKKVMVDGKKRLEEERIEYADEQVVIPANVTAQIFYLKKRQPEKWGDAPKETNTEENADDGLLEALNAAADTSSPDDVDMLPEEEDDHAEK